jgi:crotonobetainyl-CoA:carnitine CoA-transferase CaiB-like acyl-CoA transferase
MTTAASAENRPGSTAGSPTPGATLPLSGLVVLDLTLARAGPTCVRHLADWGADVIRVQAPDDGGEEVIGKREGPDYQNMHRNKRFVTINLKNPDGHAAFLKLVAKADVLVENMRAPVKHRLKISWEDLSQVNPRLVYGSISGFGQTGPYAARPGVDQIAQGMSGMMSVTGEPGRGPMRVGIAVADLTAGNLLALAIMMALYDRQRTGKGRWVYTSLLESQIFMMDFQAARYLAAGEVPRQAGNEHPTVAPTGVFKTSDGYVNIAASSSRQWQNLCEVLEQPAWLQRTEWARQADRARNRADVHHAIGVEVAKKTSAYWVERFEAAGVPCGPIYTVDQVFADPQVQQLGMSLEASLPGRAATHLVGSPLNFDGARKTIRSLTEIAGTHTAEVLAGLGYQPAEIQALHESGAI